MGNVVSSDPTTARATDVTSESEMDTMNSTREREESDTSEEFHDTIDEDGERDVRARAKEQEMIKFREQLEIKREQRKQILARHRTEKEELEKSLEKERKAKLESYEINKQLRDLLSANNIAIPTNIQATNEDSNIAETIMHMKEEFEKFKYNNNKLRRDLVEANSSLQNAYSDIADLNFQNTESIKQINALKEVVTVSKTMLSLREEQLTELKNKLSEIEKSLADREASMLSTDLRQEYERQLQNIRTLRGLYEERARLAEVTRQSLVRELEEQRILKQAEINKCKDLVAKVEELEAKVDNLHEIIENKNSIITSCQEETRGLKAEMSVVNKLFSQVLLGYKNKQDLDKLVHRLEENHGLLTHMAERENGSEASSALPKLLLELVSQVDEEEDIKDSTTVDVNGETLQYDDNPVKIENQNSQSTSAEEIVENLPKVWRVLIELLSHQSAPDDNASEKVTTCYKSVDTKAGPVQVPSVSQTYIRLKDLIVEKLTLIKEVNRMKQLNSHLETRLGEQERRLCMVTTELSKTWHVVGRLRRHHHQLHTHEKILKYELQQKRKLLNELKEELEYCREKWEQAREKNTQSEKDWRKLRAEFTSRKTKVSPMSFNNSAESGYSDERPSDDSSEDESEYVTEPLIRSKKKLKKSFETIVDSSADFNLAAEREDPVSDMIDVADLPLDAQEGDDHHEVSVSDSYSESVLKSEKLCDETEDEIGEITNDSCHEDAITTECGETSTVQSEEYQIALSQSTNSSQSTSTIYIDPASIMENIRLQNERLARKDKKLEKLEKSGAALLQQTKTTAKISDQINSTLDHLINRPTSSRSSNSKVEYKPEGNQNSELAAETESSVITSTSDSAQDAEIPSCSNINFKAIEENDKKQDSQIEILENSCSEIVQNLSETLNASDQIIDKVNNLHSERRSPIEENKSTECKTDETRSGEGRDSSEPSTSSEMDHEARFAARDIRLKRLEEQTKSLVNKVNNTATKGVKIHYKLEELHNIYGSENSRAGTPSEDSGNRSSNEDENQNDNT